MIIAVDETGDANLDTRNAKFAVGALYVADENVAKDVIRIARNQIGAPTHVFHFCEDGPEARKALADAIDKSPFAFHFRIVGYGHDIPAEMLGLPQRDVHARLLAQALNLLLYLPTSDVILSAREASLREKTLPQFLSSIESTGDRLVTELAELRRNPADLSKRVTLTQGTQEEALQICDHLLGRWNASVRENTPWAQPMGSMAIAATAVNKYFTIAQMYRNDFSAIDMAETYSKARPSIGDTVPPLFAVYNVLASKPPGEWTFNDHELNRILLNTADQDLYSKHAVSHLSFLILEGRTRWPFYVPFEKKAFELYRVAANAFLYGNHSIVEATTETFAAIYFHLKDFKNECREATIRARTNSNP